MSFIRTQLEATALAVETRGLTKKYGRQLALDHLDLTVPQGSFYLLVGANGAGKSTTLRVLLDLVRAKSGFATVFGIDSKSPHARARIGYVPEAYNEPYGWMRVEELLGHHGSYYNRWDTEYAADLLSRLEVDPGARFGRLSKGQCRRVQLVMALSHRPPLLLLDEPTDGLDPVARDVVLGILAEHLADTETTVLASTHLVYELDGLADHLGVLSGGRLSAQMRRDELETNLRSYALDTPDPWPGPDALVDRVLGRTGGPRATRWLLWGGERDVVSALAASGATVRDVRKASLEEGARALLARKAGGV